MRELSLVEFVPASFDMAGFVVKFCDLASRFDLSGNEGGVRVSGAFNLCLALSIARPTICVELGAFRGASSWFMKEFFGEALKLYSFDPLVANMVKNMPYRRPDILYSHHDFATPAFLQLIEDEERVSCFADDHQDALERILICAGRNVSPIIFDDDYRGAGDHRSFYMLQQQAKNNVFIASLLDCIVDTHVTLPIAAGWPVVFPECKAIADIDEARIYRPMTVVTLKGHCDRGWTMGNANSLLVWPNE